MLPSAVRVLPLPQGGGVHCRQLSHRQCEKAHVLRRCPAPVGEPLGRWGGEWGTASRMQRNSMIGLRASRWTCLKPIKESTARLSNGRKSGQCTRLDTDEVADPAAYGRTCRVRPGAVVRRQPILASLNSLGYAKRGLQRPMGRSNARRVAVRLLQSRRRGATSTNKGRFADGCHNSDAVGWRAQQA